MADSMDQAVENLERSWAQSRRIGWAIDRGTPAPRADVAQPTHGGARDIDAGVRHARLVAEREAVAAVVPTDPGPAYSRLRNRVQRMEWELEGLERGDGWGAWRDTPVGDAAIAWTKALGEWRWCSAQARQVGLLERRRLLRRADLAAEREGPLRDAFERLAAPERARLTAELPEAKKRLAELDGQYYGHLHFGIAHPEALRRLNRLDHQIAVAEWELDVGRQDLDGIGPRPIPEPAHERGIGLGIEREGPVLERSIGLEIGL